MKLLKFLKSLSKEKLQKFILTVVICLIAIGAVVNFYVLKNVHELSVAKEAAGKLKTQIDEVETEQKGEAAKAALREQLRAFLGVQEQRLVQGDSFSWIVREMALLAEKHPVHVANVTPGSSAPSVLKPQYDLYSTRLEVTGAYDDLGRFVRDLENSFPTCAIRTLAMVVADATRNECRINLELTLLMQPKATPTSTPAAAPEVIGKKPNA
ncbi:MAG: hypothetical protein WCS70_12100 [Verrucomicrobiota bacterium]